MDLENSRWKDGMEVEVLPQGRAGGHEQPAAGADGAAEPGEHVLHERGAAVPVQPDPPRAVFPLGEVERGPAPIGESATAFGCLVSDMWLGEFDYVSPEAFHSVFGKRYPAFSRRTQHDAQEFLICVLDDLHEAFKQPSQERQSPAAGASTRSSSGTSIITQLFEGQLSYAIRCLTCKALSDRPESFTVLSLPIPSTRVCSLQDCLECFFQPDTLTRNDQIHCYWCGSNQDATVKASITKAPQIIIFHLKRYSLSGVDSPCMIPVNQFLWQLREPVAWIPRAGLSLFCLLLLQLRHSGFVYPFTKTGLNRVVHQQRSTWVNRFH
ncbi:inactive ubiquitin carboxyl-terminal hydrolase 50 isoform X3 [Passer montanus]|uniref:inactive ubiquitin carboxyl-terminal hydrolase 50 isoform X3 n=1 Tax=Passer montanus TaxID=9160 RepID=UPI00195F9B39|nr:inactive ubiquitin carboxyl-terminal hydrolase 50 isoform X3 [Passer montanus]